MHSDGSEDNFEINSSIQKKRFACACCLSCQLFLPELSVVLEKQTGITDFFPWMLAMQYEITCSDWSELIAVSGLCVMSSHPSCLGVFNQLDRG